MRQIFCKADRQKTNDVRQVKESYEQKLSQTSKSANVEIHRLVSEHGWELRVNIYNILRPSSR